MLKGQGLPGTLPPELVSLPFLQEIDLTRNYLNGTIPPQWGSMQLINISLLGNRLTGSVPEQLANISTLTSLDVEGNKLSGTLHPVLGNLPNIARLVFSSNNFSGALPTTFANLITLKEFRISDNSFTGSIPSFIFQNWTKLETLFIQASGLSGPIPHIVGLENLSDLRISDLNGDEAYVPEPHVPELNNLPMLTKLDLSFNRLTGEIQSTIPYPNSLEQVFLNGNRFTGPIPQWILAIEQEMHLSHNYFSNRVGTCQQGNVNLFVSTSRINNSFAPSLHKLWRK